MLSNCRRVFNHFLLVQFDSEIYLSTQIFFFSGVATKDVASRSKQIKHIDKAELKKAHRGKCELKIGFSHLSCCGFEGEIYILDFS